MIFSKQAFKVISDNANMSNNRGLNNPHMLFKGIHIHTLLNKGTESDSHSIGFCNYKYMI